MYEQFPEVMNMLWARMLKDNKKNWRRVYKVCHSTVSYIATCSFIETESLRMALIWFLNF